ncbi:MAG: sugar transferase, partial [Victivallales bacterium]|nr:sugar transferase [Victivallales bacterium]
MKPDKKHVNRELMEMLIERGSSGNRYIGVKLFFWHFTIRMAYFIKRAMDITVSLLMIILLMPLLATVAVLIKLESKGPVFFIQIRVGKNGRHFNFVKFRSMRIDAEKLKARLQQQNESPDGVIFKMRKDPRMTRIGRIIRKFSIDELPQLFNVLVGDMSLVGPR